MPVDDTDTKPARALNTVGNVPYFDPELNDFKIFEVRLQQFFVANEITTEARKKAIFLTNISERAYVLLKNLLNPTTPEEVACKLDKCLSTLKNHFEPAVSAFMERSKFYKAEKQPMESVNQWAARVRALAVNCEFGTMLNMALRDKFVLGLERGPAREKIFLEGVDKVDFNKALSIATAAEYIQQNQGQEQHEETCFFMQVGAGKNRKNHQNQQQQQSRKPTQQQQKNKQQCTVCGYNSHSANVCKFRNYKCNQCHKRGHLRKMCKSENCNYLAQASSLKKADKSNVNIEQSDVLNLFSLQTNSDGPIKINVMIANKSFEMELDTGSQSCVVPLAVIQNNFPNIVLKPTTVMLRTYTGAVMKPEGMIKLKVNYNGWCKSLWFVVVKEQGPILLGREFLKQFRFKLSDLLYEEVVYSHSDQTNFMEEFPNLFDGGLGEFNKSEVHLTLKEGAQPKFCKPRPLPLALKEKVEMQIDNLVHLGVLEPVDFSEWGTPIVPILKKDGDVRICGDFKVTVNPCLKVEQYPLPRIEDIFAKLYEGREFSKLDLSMAYQQCKLLKSKNPLL